MSKSYAVIDAIIDEALYAAKEAAKKFKEVYGEPSFCGFAWVNLKPGTSAMAKRLVQRGIAHKSYAGGVDVWDPSMSCSQSMDLKEAGAIAFANVMSNYGFSCFAQTRAD